MLKKPILKIIYNLFIFLCVAVILNTASAQELSSVKNDNGTTTMRWMVGDTLREAMVYIPQTAKSKPTPVIFIFHGHGGNMLNMYKSRGFNKLWPEAIIICPQGLKTPGQLTDKEGKLPGWQKAPGDMNDRDLKFFDAMLATLKNNYNVDNSRIYSTGHSNGGGFTYLLWATRSDVFAAVAPSAAVAARVIKLLKPKPVLHIMGDKDDLVKPEWQERMFKQLLTINSCSSVGEKYDTLSTLYPSKTNNPVILYRHPGGHTYPQPANEVVIKFFKSTVKP